jgi:Dienelactone hydrolase family
MKRFWMVSGLAALAISLWQFAGRPDAMNPVPGLPSEQESTAILNTTQLHREWVSVAWKATGVRGFIVYPARSDNAPVLMISAKGQSASTWMRAVAVRAADQGYIAVVPDLLSGKALKGGDSNSFPTAEAIAEALDRMGADEAAARAQALLDFAVALPAANGRSAHLTLDPSRKVLDIQAEGRSAAYSLDAPGWQNAAGFLAESTNNHPVRGVNASLPEDHSMHKAPQVTHAAS